MIDIILTAVIMLYSCYLSIQTIEIDPKSFYPANKNTEGLNVLLERSNKNKYHIIAAPGMEELALKIVGENPDRFLYHATNWGKFPDGTDNIEIGGFQPINRISGQHVLLLASFHNNDVTLSQFSVMITLLQSFIESLTVVLPFYPVGTMERVVRLIRSA